MDNERGPARFKFATNPVVLVAVVTLVGFLVRLRGITWGLPYLYDPDEHYFVDPAVRLVISGDLNPHWFGHPGSTVIYLLGLMYAVYWIVGHSIGWFPDLHAFETLFATNPTSFYLIGRILAVALATLAVPLTYALCRHMAGMGAGLVAASIVAVSPLHAEYSRIVRTDPLMTTFLLAAMFYAVKAMDDQLGKHFFLSGLFVGLATATKYPGIIGAMMVVMVTGFAKPTSPVAWTERGRWLYLAILGGIIGFFGATPFVVTAVREIYWDLVAQGTGPHLGATGSPGLANYLWYLKGPLQEAVGWPVKLFALVGLAASCRAGSRARLLLAGFSLLFLLGVGLSARRFDRWIVPLTPFVAILAAIGLEATVRAVAWLRSRPVVQDLAVVALGLALVIPSATEAFQQGGATLDTRDIAKNWIEDHVPRGSRVLLEQYTPPISRDEYQVFIVSRGELQKDTTTRGFKGALGDLKSLDLLREKRIDYVLVSNIYFDRFEAEKKNYPAEARLYEELFRAADLAYELKPTGRTRGGVIRLLKLRQSLDRESYSPRSEGGSGAVLYANITR